MEKLKDILTVVFLLAIVVVWGAHVFVSWRNDIRRHNEVGKFIELFQNVQGGLLASYANIITNMQSEKTLFIYRDEEGILHVRTVQRHEEKAIGDALKKQQGEEATP